MSMGLERRSYPPPAFDRSIDWHAPWGAGTTKAEAPTRPATARMAEIFMLSRWLWGVGSNVGMGKLAADLSLAWGPAACPGLSPTPASRLRGGRVADLARCPSLIHCDLRPPAAPPGPCECQMWPHAGEHQLKGEECLLLAPRDLLLKRARSEQQQQKMSLEAHSD